MSKIGPGLVALIGVCKEDTDEDIPKLVKKVLGAKLWNEGAKSRTPAGGGADKGSIVQAIQTLSDGSTSTVSSAEISEDPTPAGETGDKVGGEHLWGGRPWRSNLMDIGGEILCVSQFTLYAQMSKGTKPDFHRAMSGPPAKDLYEKFLQQLREGYQASRVLGASLLPSCHCVLTRIRWPLWRNDGCVPGQLWSGHHNPRHARKVKWTKLPYICPEFRRLRDK